MEKKWRRDGRASNASKLLLEDPALTLVQACQAAVNEAFSNKNGMFPAAPLCGQTLVNGKGGRSSLPLGLLPDVKALAQIRDVRLQRL